VSGNEPGNERDQGNELAPQALVVAVQLAPGDHVANLLVAVGRGERVVLRSGRYEQQGLSTSGPPGASTSASPIVALERIPRFHKIALTALRVGSEVVRDGYVIGLTSEAVEPGQWLHTHNLKSARA